MKYKFVGEGMGVPGLPHEISDEEAIEMGVVELLQAAIENGNYVEEAMPESIPEKEMSEAQTEPAADVDETTKKKWSKHGQ